MDLTRFLKLNGNKYPNKLGYVFEDEGYTYQQVMMNSARLAEYLKQKGVHKGDKVCTLFYNCIECAYSYFGLLMLGAVVVPVNFRSAGAEISYIVNHSDAKGIIFGREFQASIDEINHQLINLKFLLPLRKEDQLFSPQKDEKFVTLFDDGPEMTDESFILYTSGTTGKPKGVVVTHYHNIWNQFNIIVDSPLSRGEVMINPMPLFHAGALGRFMAMTMVGATFITWKAFDARKVMAAVSKYRASFICLVPAMFRMILQLPELDTYDVSSLRSVFLTAANVPVEMKKQALQLFQNAQIIDGYGLTEMTSNVAMLKGKDVLEKTASVGLPGTVTEVKIVNDDFEEVSSNVVGEIAVRGPNVMKEYYKDPKATAETIKNGWLLTGDLGRKDESDYLYIVGRKKEMIISGGENIYPAEVEAALNEHPKILESAVIGIPDAKWGETVMALIVLKQGAKMTEEEVENYCKERIARYKRPRIIKFVDSLVRNTAGKVMKHEMKRLYGG